MDAMATDPHNYELFSPVLDSKSERAGEDPDGDGFTTCRSLAGTDPADSASYFHTPAS